MSFALHGTQGTSTIQVLVFAFNYLIISSICGFRVSYFFNVNFVLGSIYVEVLEHAKKGCYPCFGIVYSVELLGSNPIILHNKGSKTRSVNWGFERY